MIGKVKKLLGIEGAKLTLDVPYEVRRSDTSISGDVVLYGMNESVIETISIKMVEKYSRGRRKSKLTDEYKITDLFIDGPWTVQPNKDVRVPFTLEFDLLESAMDRFAGRNFFYAGLAKVAKKFKGVKSEYSIEAEADAEGAVLNPFDKKIIKVI